MSSEATNELIKTLCQIAALMLTPVIFFISSLIIRCFQKKNQPKWNGVLLEEIMAALDPHMISTCVSEAEAYEALCCIIKELQSENET